VSLTIHVGDALEVLQTLPDGCVQCCVTSPPYWGLRDYGVPGQIGMEATPEEFCAVMVRVFREVRRVLRPDGTCWVNMGDAYANDGKWGGSTGGKHVSALHGNSGVGRQKKTTGLKPKDLCGIPWRVAFALQADGWYLRSDIIWHKPNAMPESVTDRPTKSHEYLFLFSKSMNYYYDQHAITEPCSDGTHPRRPVNGKTPAGWDTSTGEGGHSSVHKNGRDSWKGSQFHSGKTGDHQLGRSQTERKHDQGTKNNASFDAAMAVMPERRNKRTVWTVPTAPYKEAHFATYPSALIRPCILAGSRPGDTVLDPFLGSGTTGMVALELGRKCIGIELNPEYAALARKRCAITPGMAI
jgi:DNA modification methylase